MKVIFLDLNRDLWLNSSKHIENDFYTRACVSSSAARTSALGIDEKMLKKNCRRILDKLYTKYKLSNFFTKKTINKPLIFMHNACKVRCGKKTFRQTFLDIVHNRMYLRGSRQHCSQKMCGRFFHVWLTHKGWKLTANCVNIIQKLNCHRGFSVYSSYLSLSI